MTMRMLSVSLLLCAVMVLTTAAVKNLARGGQVAQSSVAHRGQPERAIDGNRASVWSQNSCTHTGKDTRPWWVVDLRKTYKVHSVKITNRKDCCAERINGAEIRIGNSLNNNGNGNPICAVINSIRAGFTRTFTCNGMEGQFVNIVIPGRAESLTLCEVEVFGTEKEDDVKNLARGGQVAQSSVAHGGQPERAIDGNRASVWSQNSCTHTGKDTRPWWVVDLRKTYKVHSVKITNRKDCCAEWINGAEIRIGNSLNNNGNGNPICAVINSIRAGFTRTFTCNGMEGQFVNIVIPGRAEYLTLCEVEVFGTEKEDDVKNLERGGQVAQSSVAYGGHPERAIDGNRASVWSQNSCTHTGKDTRPWWVVDLRKTYKVHSVKITNRKDYGPERINGAEIRIGNSLNNNGNGNPSCAVIDSIPAGFTRTFTCNGMEGQLVNIVIPGRAEYLTLCEVEVFGTEKEDDVKNLERGGQVAQSSVAHGGHPERAIDGNRASVWTQNSCTHTGKDTRPWWVVDLRKTYKVHSVKITNRKDCCAERINGAEIRIGNSLNNNGNGNPICAVIDSIPAGFTKTFTCNGMEGQFVNIVIPGRAEYLTLCEVEVFGA